MNTPTFISVTLTGNDSIKFLQGQTTCDTKKIQQDYQATAISNLKGRIQFGIWIKQENNIFEIVICADCAEELIAHIKKFGAFSKITLGEQQVMYPYLDKGLPSFTLDETLVNVHGWMKQSIATGNYWITADMQDIYQPQEMRLHQRGGVDYDKGCYLGQEVIARIFFKSAPKSFLHRISANGDTPNSNDGIGERSRIKVINAITVADNRFEALVIARPDLLSDFEQLELPTALTGGVSRDSMK